MSLLIAADSCAVWVMKHLHSSQRNAQAAAFCCCLSSFEPSPVAAAAAAASPGSSAAAPIHAGAVNGATCLLRTALSRSSSTCSQGLLAGMRSSQVCVCGSTPQTQTQLSASDQHVELRLAAVARLHALGGTAATGPPHTKRPGLASHGVVGGGTLHLNHCSLAACFTDTKV
ncbi:hypothetical protein COO60DRAFT_1523960 [Scenedesmus sp. NREL 46B-D3]|nr:hypothetical protein COO60DRAFT_1523960 [Scenedesmus sp. NREL 46B-D3]